MKTLPLLFIIIILGFQESKAQNYAIETDFTSKFIGETMGLNINRQMNHHIVSGGLVFYLNLEPQTKYDMYDKHYLFTPLHFGPLKDNSYGDRFLNRFGLDLKYIYILNNKKDVQPYLFIEFIISNIGFRQYAFPPNPLNEFTVSPNWFVMEVFPGIGLMIKLSDHINLSQSISAGILYIDALKISSFSSAMSLNPQLKIGLEYRF
jgi:hypothetical protein